MDPLRFEVAGRIFKDPESEGELYVSVIDAWSISTSGRTVDEAMLMTWRLIDAHLDAARTLGVLDRELEKVGVKRTESGTSARHLMHVKARFAFESEADISMH